MTVPSYQDMTKAEILEDLVICRERKAWQWAEFDRLNKKFAKIMDMKFMWVQMEAVRELQTLLDRYEKLQSSKPTTIEEEK